MSKVQEIGTEMKECTVDAKPSDFKQAELDIIYTIREVESFMSKLDMISDSVVFGERPFPVVEGKEREISSNRFTNISDNMMTIQDELRRGSKVLQALKDYATD